MTLLVVKESWNGARSFLVSALNEKLRHSRSERGGANHNVTLIQLVPVTKVVSERRSSSEAVFDNDVV